MPAYVDEDAFAVRHNYADWDAYATANPNSPTLLNLTEVIEECSEIINRNIGSFNTNISSSTYLSSVEKLCLRMVDRMLGIDTMQRAGNFTPYSLADYLQEREREFLKQIGRALGHRSIGKLVF